MIEGRKKSQNDHLDFLFNNMARDLGSISDLRSIGHWKFYGIWVRYKTGNERLYQLSW
jgi:hypothetical protein